MRGKKIIAAVLALVVIAGAVVAGVVLHGKKKEDVLPDIRETPIPQTIDAASALQDTTLAGTPLVTNEATEQTDGEKLILFGQYYDAHEWYSTRKYSSEEGLESAAQRRTTYFGEDGSLLYTSLVDEGSMAVYNADDVAVYSSGSYKVDADYLTEPVHWFYKAGAAACAELCFYDGDNNGVAYYNADGVLLCVRTEIYKAVKGSVQMQTVFYDRTFTEITEDDFNALMPQTDADAFLYINWA